MTPVLEVAVTLPLRTASESNIHKGWREKWRRSRSQKDLVYLFLQNAKKEPPLPPLRIDLTRIAPRRLDSGNLERSFKAVQDAVAEYLRIDDGDLRLDWRYHQERGDPKSYGLRIEIWSTSERE